MSDENIRELLAEGDRRDIAAMQIAVGDVVIQAGRNVQITQVSECGRMAIGLEVLPDGVEVPGTLGDRLRRMILDATPENGPIGANLQLFSRDAMTPSVRIVNEWGTIPRRPYLPLLERHQQLWTMVWKYRKQRHGFCKRAQVHSLSMLRELLI